MIIVPLCTYLEIHTYEGLTLLQGILQQYNGSPIMGQSIHHPSWMMDKNERVAGAMVALSCFFVAVFAMTWGPISWIYPAEIFPTPVRARAVALCTAARWCCSVSVALSVPHLCEWKNEGSQNDLS